MSVSHWYGFYHLNSNFCAEFIDYYIHGVKRKILTEGVEQFRVQGRLLNNSNVLLVRKIIKIMRSNEVICAIFGVHPSAQQSYLRPFKINCIHERALKILDTGMLSFQKPLKLQIWFCSIKRNSHSLNYKVSQF